MLIIISVPQVQEEVFQNYGGDLRAWLEDNLSMLEQTDNLREYIPKFALHGFWGSPIELLKLYKKKENEYLVEHMNKIKEAIKQDKQARKVEERKRSIRIDWTEEVGYCGMKKGKAVKEKDLCTRACSKCAYAREF